jgi:hypothetical protein
VSFLIKGTGFQPGNTELTFSYPTNKTLLNLTHGYVLDTVTATTINGTIVVPYYAPTGSWNVSVATLDGGEVWKSQAFKVAEMPGPTIDKITPSDGLLNGTVAYTIKGRNFQPGQTTVTLFRSDFGEMDTTVYSVTPTQIVGGFRINPTATPGIWAVNVSTFDGGLTKKPGKFTVKNVPPPSVTRFTPATGYRGTTISFIVDGKNFQAGGMTTVNLTLAGEEDIGTVLTSVYTSRIYGTATIPAGAATGAWKVNVSTVDGHYGIPAKAISIL